ncbi:MAG TPA: ABC transporter substrate-binding protein, partial [Phycisphaerae bacterium]|nr:ABC transporter substrate-binding protein [Phycisphaerae bacterium]
MFHGESGPFFDPLRRGFAELGYVEGRTLVVESQFAQGRIDRLPALAAELVDLNVDIIVAVGALSAQAAGRVTTKTPIVFSAAIDPVAIGLVESLDRPGSNITGVISADPNQPTKQFELLKQILPKLTRVALLSEEEILPDTHSDRGLNPLERANDTAA